MKTSHGILAVGGVAGVAGFALAALLLGGNGAPPASSGGEGGALAKAPPTAQALESASERPRTAGPETAPGGGPREANGSDPSSSGGPAGVGPSEPVGGYEAPPPPPPPPPSEILDEAARRGPDGPGNGRVIPLVVKDPAEATRRDERRRKSWEDRLRREVSIKMLVLKQKLGLTEQQQERLRGILDAELKQRLALVDRYAAKQMGREAFDEAVRTNVESARQQLRETLTTDQYEAYLQLKPREQVLRDETK